MRTTVAILVIGHKYGTNVSAHVDEEDARRSILEYVRENWSECNSSLDNAPEDQTEAIETYFDEHPREESFEVTIADVEGLREPERWVVYCSGSDIILGNPLASQEEAILMASEMDDVLVLPLRTGVS